MCVLFTSHSYCPISASVALMTVRLRIPLRASFRMQYFSLSINSLPSLDHLHTTQIGFCNSFTHTCNNYRCLLELPYLIRGKGAVSVEQENWMSSPLMRQALSSRDTNLGGAGGVRRAVRPAAMNNYKNSCEIAVITGNWFEVEEAEEEAEENSSCVRASIILPCTTTLASVPALPMKLLAKQVYCPESPALRLSRMRVHVPEESAKMM